MVTNSKQSVATPQTTRLLGQLLATSVIPEISVSGEKQQAVSGNTSVTTRLLGQLLATSVIHRDLCRAGDKQQAVGWSEVLPLTACCLSPLTEISGKHWLRAAAPIVGWSEVLPLTACCLSPLTEISGNTLVASSCQPIVEVVCQVVSLTASCLSPLRPDLITGAAARNQCISRDLSEISGNTLVASSCPNSWVV